MHIAKVDFEHAYDVWYRNLSLDDKLSMFNRSHFDYATRECAETAIDEMWDSLSFNEKVNLYSDFN